MEGITKTYIENPTLVVALSIGVAILAWAVWWLIKWVLKTLIPAMNNNTSALNRVASSIDRFEVTMGDSIKIMAELTTEQKLLNQQLQRVLDK